MSTCGKKSWSTEEYAERALADIHRRPHPGGRRLELRTYHCRECGHYHLTSKADRYWERPSQAELWRRHQLALSLLNQRGHTADVAALVVRVLNGALIDDLRSTG